MKLVVLALLLHVAACKPWYRDRELRALRAEDTKPLNRLLEQADAKLDAKQYKDAAELFDEIIEIDPSRANAYVGLARAKVGAGNRVAAIAIARFAVIRFQSSSARELLVTWYAEDELVAKALEELGPNSIDDAVTRPALASPLGELAAAVKHVRGGRYGDARTAYERWLQRYGIPDHALLRRWADEVLEPTATVFDPQPVRVEDRDAIRRQAIATRMQPSSRAKDVRIALAAIARALPDASALGSDAAAATVAAADAVARDQLGPAIGHYRRAIAAAPWWPELYYNLAVLLASAELYDEAAHQMAWYVELSPSDARDAEARRLQDAWRERSGRH